MILGTWTGLLAVKNVFAAVSPSPPTWTSMSVKV